MTAEVTTLPLLRGSTTLEDALEQEENMLLSLSYPEQRIDFFTWLYGHWKDIEDIVSYHLGLTRSEQCRLGEVKEWIHGSFNVCIPVYIDNWAKHPGRRVIIRFPLPYKVGESAYPGNVDEKLRCEAATYIWMREYCPNIPTPHLWGFGFVGGQSFTRPENVSLKNKFFWYLKRHISWIFRFPLSCHYISHHRYSLVEHGYLVMDYINDPGVEMLSETWSECHHQQDKRVNLFRDLSRIMLSLSNFPLPCIGSWTLDSNGVLQLSNRPLTLRLHQLENEGISTNINRDSTYPTADSYYLDILSCHDIRIRHQPNSIFDEDDGRAQMANLTMMRALLPHFTYQKFRRGPFFYKLTDIHQSNIFVDGNWNIKCLIDLEWACSLPVEAMRPPYWLTDRSADNIIDEHLDAFNQRYNEFMDIFEEEEEKLPSIYGDSLYRTHAIRNGWKIGNFWYFQALDSPKGMFNIFRDHIQPAFASSHNSLSEFSRVVSDYWAVDGSELITAKLQDKEVYEKRLRQQFLDASNIT